MGRKVVIQKVDLDTALSALLLGVTQDDEIVVVRDKAPPEDLADPKVICIECGGSGEVERGNFDHHDTKKPLPPACVQAFNYVSKEDAKLSKNAALRELVEYVATRDTQGPKAIQARGGDPGFPSLSDVFSGMLLCTKDPKDQLLRGMEILRLLLERKISAFGRMPELPEWGEFIAAKKKNDEEVKKAVESAEFFLTRSGLKAAFVEAQVPGVLGALYEKGAQVVIAYCKSFGNPPVPKYTIGGNGVRVDGLRPLLAELEEGWGGPAHGTILGSPRTGSKLPPQKIKELVCQHL
jgi:hypothetical protein